MIEVENESKEIGNPFPGLRPFETHEYELFFGREGQSDALISKLQHAHFLAVVGTSGSGKSSLVRAGLLPALRGGMMAGAGSGWRIAVMRPGSDPIGNLAIVLAGKDVLLNAGGGLPEAEAQAVIEATLRRGALGLVEVARQARLAEHEKLLIVVDQFEELFRFRAARAASSTGDDAAAFVKLLLEAAQQNELPIYVVPTMRSDFLGDCAQFQGLPEAINDGQYLIPRMTRDERRFAITGPVGVTRGKITAPLVNRLMNDVGDNPDQLPILQHALMRTWEYWDVHRSNGQPIDLKDYEAVGTMTDALSKHADEAFNELPDKRSRHVAEILFKSLTERGADNREIRHPTSLADICEIAGATVAEVSAVVEVFRGGGRSFLMPPAEVPLKPETIIDISHESLIRNWDRLQKWVDEEAQSARTYRRLAEAAVLHREGKEGLATDPALQIALDWYIQHLPNAAWARRYHSEFDTAITFLEASRKHRDAEVAAQEREREEKIERDRRELEQAQLFAEQQRRAAEQAQTFAEQQRRAARRLRWLAAGMAVMFLLAMVAVGVAFKLRNDAVNEKNRARLAEQNAEAQTKIAREEKGKAEGEFKRAEGEKKKAEGEFKRAEGEKKKALEEFDRAEGEKKKALIEAERANTQAGIAAQNLDTANKATTAASSIVRRAIPVVSQGDLLLKGSEAYRRAELDQALNFFNVLRQQLEALSSNSSAQSKTANLTIEELQRYAKDLGQYEQFNLQLGWTLSHIGSTHLRKGDQVAAIEAYEKSLKVLGEGSADPIVFETYLGLAEAYQSVAVFGRPKQGQVVPDKSGAQNDFTTAEQYLVRALNFQQGAMVQESWLVADTHLRLARLYVDAGKFKEAEASYKRAVDGKRRGKNGNTLDNSERAALVSAMKELADFYQGQAYGQENRSEDAVRVLNEMITVQEDVEVEQLAGAGQEIANSYNDLGQVYLMKGDKNKADDQFRLANVLQRTALKLRRIMKSQDPAGDVALLNDLANDFDELGDAYVKLGKLRDAEVVYNASLESRKNGNLTDVGKSYDKLAALYRVQKNYGKADEIYNKLLALYRNNPRRSADYARALLQVGSFYNETPSASPDAAVSTYRSALQIYQDLGDWYGEDVVLYRLTKIFEKRNQPTERLQALGERVATLEKYFDQLVAGKAIRPNDPAKLTSEYLQAVNALAFFHTGENNNGGALAAYQRAFERRDYITGKTREENTLKFYAAVLGEYQTLLTKLNNKTLAASVGEVRDKLNKAQESKLTQGTYAAAAQ